ncbi:MAG: hypothetical protein GX299_05555 [Epulopiscium sp.]|nr:hypothetical protein [Candidatus Epulonipiscium sp.]
MGKYWRSVLNGFMLGAFVFLWADFMELPLDDTLWILLTGWISFCVVLIGYYFIIQKQFYRKLWEFTKLLLDSQDVSGYLRQYEEMLRKTKRPGHRQILLMNYATGYSLKGEYEKAAEILEQVQEQYLPEMLRMAKYQGMAYNFFMAGEISKGWQVVVEHYQGIEECMKKGYGISTMALTLALGAFTMGHIQKGFELLVTSIQSGIVPWEIQNAKLIWAREALLQDRDKEAAEILEELLQEKTMPNVELGARRLLGFIKQQEKLQ